MPTTDSQAPASEAAIFGRLLSNGKPELSRVMARHILSLTLSEEDQARMHELAEKNQAGTISAADKEELLNYVKVGHLLAVLQSKARLTLKKKAR